MKDILGAVPFWMQKEQQLQVPELKSRAARRKGLGL